MKLMIIGSLLFLSTMPGLRADDAMPAKTAPKSTAETTAYRIAAQDVLDITVQDHADLSKSAVVLPDGTISYPYVGEFKASGMTLREISDRITIALSKEIAGPQVTVTIKSLHERPASLVSITSPRATGKYTLKEGWRVLDLLIEAGGLPTEPHLAFTASILRNGTEKIPVDLAHIFAATDLKANLLLEPGDVLMVQQIMLTPSVVQVLGEVAHTGPVALPRDGSLVTVLTAAGGPSARAALSRCTITHDGKTTTVDLNSFLTTGQIDPSIKLEPGDTLFVPQNTLIFKIYGAVARQGLQPYPDSQQITVQAALSQAGGTSSDANMKKVSVIHPIKGKPSQLTTIDLEEAIKKGDNSKDIVLQPGDTLFVPSHRHPGTSFGLASVLSALPFVGFLGMR